MLEKHKQSYKRAIENDYKARQEEVQQCLDRLEEKKQEQG